MRAARDGYVNGTRDGHKNPGKTGHEEYGAALVARTLRECQGIVSAAAKRLGCSQTTVMRYVRAYPTVRRALDEARGEFVDLAKIKLKQAVTNGEPWAIQFVLNKFGKGQPWLEDAAGADGGQGALPGGSTAPAGGPVIREVVVEMPALPPPGGDQEQEDAAPVAGYDPTAGYATVIEAEATAIE